MAPILASLFAAAAPELSKKGLDLLGGIFRGLAKQGADKVKSVVEEKTGIQLGDHASTIENLIKEKTGIQVSDIAENKLTPDQWVKLKEFELQHEELLQKSRDEVQKYELELEKVLNEDRANARATQTKRDDNSDWVIRRFIYHYAYLITALTFLFIFLVIFAGPKDDDRSKWRMIDTILGFLLGVGVSAIIQFFYGSSMGSKQKSDLLNARSAEDGGGKK